MKRYVKSSFGLRDEDWVDPPEGDFESEECEIELQINDAVVDYTDEMGGGFDFTKYEFEDQYDAENDNLVITGDDLFSEFFDAFPYSRLPEEPGFYKLSCTILIPYTEFTPTRQNRYDKYGDLTPAEAEVDYKNIYVKNVEFSR